MSNLGKIKMTCTCVILALSACGVETAGSAATAAAVKQQEIQQGRETLDRVKQQLQQATQASEQRDRQADEAAR
ncbi:MAG: hypothetical protein NTX37_14540 [Burkholderiales bacterium]|nr:hypothetical protein [Burkholderiales bacterium]